MRILVVEDEPLLAMMLEENLSDLGHEMVGTAATVDQAFSLLDTETVDAALLDFSLGHDATSAPIAQRLQNEGKPFYYLSGHASLEESDAPNAPLLTKPVAINALMEALQTLEAARTRAGA